jgi:hypothetical protein
LLLLRKRRSLRKVCINGGLMTARNWGQRKMAVTRREPFRKKSVLALETGKSRKGKVLTFEK